MKLKTYNQQTLPVRTATRSPFIRIGYDGTWNFSSGAVALLGLEEGRHVLLHQDEENPRDWYISVAATGGYPLRKQVKKDRTCVYQMNQKRLLSLLMASLGLEGEKYRSVYFPLSKAVISSGHGDLRAIFTSNYVLNE